jgi:uncharacterized protein YndB with AHSA1/START domain
MTTKIFDDRSLEIQRIIKAPRDRVYAAWTDPAQLQQWFGPDGVKTVRLVADPRVGGNYTWQLVNQENEEMTVHGEYRELQPGRKIVFTWQWEDDEAWKEQNSVVTVDLSDCEGGTLVRLSHDKLPSEASRDRHNQGWTSVLDKLETFFAK